jgi:lysophospholipase L1-like esterase
MQRLNANTRLLAGFGIVVLALAVGLAIGLGTGALGSDSSRAPSPSSVALESPSGSASVTAEPTATPLESATPSPTGVPSPTVVPSPAAAATSSTPQLPTMLAAIGDSYSQAWSVSPSYRKDHPVFSWVVGTAKGDGVFSLRERFEALGARLAVVDAATSGKKMSDASRQATAVVIEAAKLPLGSTVYVTFELGTNDLCDEPMTTATDFETQLRSAVSILRADLPAGSRILMLSVPDFSHFYDITQADATARATLSRVANSTTCPPFLGRDSPYSMSEAEATLASYDSILVGVCSEIEAADGPSNKLHCRSNPTLLAERDFKIKDLSTYDYFHPSLSGQARMAAAAWKAGYWSAATLPPGAAAVAPGAGSGESGTSAVMGLAAGAPLFAWRGRRRRPRPWRCRPAT